MRVMQTAFICKLAHAETGSLDVILDLKPVFFCIF